MQPKIKAPIVKYANIFVIVSMTFIFSFLKFYNIVPLSESVYMQNIRSLQ
jgi:hypothetical protein